jgi:hypothetical protein
MFFGRLRRLRRSRQTTYRSYPLRGLQTPLFPAESAAVLGYYCLIAPGFAPFYRPFPQNNLFSSRKTKKGFTFSRKDG